MHGRSAASHLGSVVVTSAQDWPYVCCDDGCGLIVEILLYVHSEKTMSLSIPY